jgi:hypothetical protein
MACLLKVPGCVSMLRIVAATDVAAAQADPQLVPGATDPQAILATVGARRHVADLVEMRAACHRSDPDRPQYY